MHFRGIFRSLAVHQINTDASFALDDSKNLPSGWYETLAIGAWPGGVVRMYTQLADGRATTLNGSTVLKSCKVSLMSKNC